MALLRKVLEIEVGYTIKRVILTELDVDQYHQGQGGSKRQLRLGHPDHLGRLERHFWEKFMKFKLFLPLT